MADKDTTKTTVKTAKAVEPTLIPRETEKTYREQTKRTYAFFVERGASKQAIAKQVAEEFGVTVTGVRTLLRKGKPTRFSRGKHAYPGTTYRQDKKLAYVTLKEGDKIAVFVEEEAAKAEEKKAKTGAKIVEKATKKAEKAAKKATKEEK